MVSVCMKEWRCVNGIDEEKMGITVFFANASAKCFAPTALIRLPERSSMVSVCVKKWIKGVS